ncbi:MAG: M3 family oligoendopeptidase, partial [Clostridia bacterium]|nr:M3 family oligoendopeptidase [Clostridia bacterium]
MKFKEMQYVRPEADEVKQHLKALTEKLSGAASYDEARAIFFEKEEAEKQIMTMAELAMIRHSIDTRDEFYDGESNFWDSFGPELGEYTQAWTMALLKSPFRPDFEKEFGDLMFINAEIELKSFSPEIIPEMQKENEL